MTGEPLINVDWLQFFVDLSEYVIAYDGEEKVLPVKARTFSEVVDLYLHNEYVGQICRKPFSSVMNATAGTFKIENKILYAENAVAIIQSIFDSFRIYPLSLTRIDICGDFETIAGGEPSQLILDLINGEKLKVGHSRMYFHGQDMWKIKGMTQIGDKTWVAFNSFEAVGSSDSRRLDYLRYGTNNSNVCTYLYNKTKELREVKDKPYIRQRWIGATLDVWRLEFSIKGRRLSFIEKESGVVLPSRWQDFFSPIIVTYYASLCEHYFNIRENTNQQRKDREQRVQLFGDYDGEICMIKDINDKHPSNRTDRQFVRQLWEQMRKAELIGNHELAVNYQQAGVNFVKEHDLKDWARKKGYWFELQRVVQNILPIL